MRWIDVKSHEPPLEEAFVIDENEDIYVAFYDFKTKTWKYDAGKERFTEIYDVTHFCVPDSPYYEE
jgi:hypothetical protein